MPIPVTCPSCGASYRLGDPLAGKTVRCPACKNPIRVPAAPAPAPPPAPAAEEIPYAIPKAKALPVQPAEPLPREGLQTRSDPLPPPRPTVVPTPRDKSDRPAGARSQRALSPAGEVIVTSLIVGGVALGILLLILLMVAMRGGFSSAPEPMPVAVNEPLPKPPPPMDKIKDDEKRFFDRKDFDDRRLLDKKEVDDKRFLEKKEIDDKRFLDKVRDDKDRFDKGLPVKEEKEPPEKVLRLALPDLPAELPSLRPPELEGQRVERQLPGAVASVAVGGGGRYLVLHLPQPRQLALFDVTEGKVVRQMAAPEEKVKFAAGANKLLVALPDAGKLERWSLPDLRREASEALPWAGPVDSLTMGSASSGPLLIYARRKENVDAPGRGVLVDPATLRTIELPRQAGLPDSGAFVRASADGRTFAMRQGVGGEPHSVATVQLRPDQVLVKSAWNFPSSLLIPGPEGKHIYSGSGITGADLPAPDPNSKPRSWGGVLVPAAHGPYFLRLVAKQWDKVGGALDFYLEGQEKPFAGLDIVEGVTGEQISYGQLRDKLPHDQRLIFIPDAKLLVTIPAGENRLILYRFDVDAALAKSGQDHLVVTSRPVPVARKGQAYAYQLAVKSNKGGVSYRLAEGPPGMQVTADGRVTWTVPANFERPETDVVLMVRDARGIPVRHLFRIAVR